MSRFFYYNLHIFELSFTFKANSDIIYVFNLFVKVIYSTEQWEEQPQCYEKLVNRFVKEEKMSKNFNEEIADELKDLGGRLVLIEDKDKGTASESWIITTLPKISFILNLFIKTLI